MNARISTSCCFILALLLTGCAASAGVAQESRAGRFLLYDRYTRDLGREDKGLKDAFVFSVATGEPVVALTFDDGPSEQSGSIVAILKKLDCPATFFLTAAQLTPETVAPYRNSLFGTGLHGYTHEHLRKFDRERCGGDVGKARAAFAAVGMPTNYFRPPYGEITVDLKSALSAQHLTGILWSLDSLDWNHLSGDKLVDRVVANVRSGDIVLLHEVPWTAEALEKMIAGIRARGFRIVSLNELLAFPKSPSPE